MGLHSFLKYVALNIRGGSGANIAAQNSSV